MIARSQPALALSWSLSKPVTIRRVIVISHLGNKRLNLVQTRNSKDEYYGGAQLVKTRGPSRAAWINFVTLNGNEKVGGGADKRCVSRKILCSCSSGEARSLARSFVWKAIIFPEGNFFTHSRRVICDPLSLSLVFFFSFFFPPKRKLSHGHYFRWSDQTRLILLARAPDLFLHSFVAPFDAGLLNQFELL